MLAASYNLILLFNIISFLNELSAVTLISKFPFIEREIGFNEPVDPNRSVRANDHECNSNIFAGISDSGRKWKGGFG